MVSDVHPYPAMMPYALASDLATRWVDQPGRLLDPFCGTGRTLEVAAFAGCSAVGLDVNPLALLIARSRFADVTRDRLDQVAQRLCLDAGKSYPASGLELEPGRKVRWFSPGARKGLSSIVRAINRADLTEAELACVAVALSASARATSYCRQDSWKLHRQRIRDPWKPEEVIQEFRKRMAFLAAKRSDAFLKTAGVELRCLDARRLGDATMAAEFGEKFRYVFSSPPYGDSRTTVGYGDVSSLCLGVVRHLERIDIPFASGGEINARCLGGAREELASQDRALVAGIWSGRSSVAKMRVASFLKGLRSVLIGASQLVVPGGRVIIVIGRRRVAGAALKTDLAIEKWLVESGLKLEERTVRAVTGKRVPLQINRYGRSLEGARRSRGLVRTMCEERVLVFEKPNLVGSAHLEVPSRAHCRDSRIPGFQ